MSASTEEGHHPEGNKLLAALPIKELERLRPHLEAVALETKQTLNESNTPIEHVYFPIDCVGSMVATMENGSIVEVGTIGNEGIVGLPVFLGAEMVPLDVFCQVPGDAMRMTSDALRTEVGPGDRLHEVLQRYTKATFVFAAQSSACNRLHSTKQRCSRWLLHTHDRVGNEEFLLTHEFLSFMLGVRRASVSEVASELQRVGLISYSRGRIRVTDRLGLEDTACECYEVIKKEFDDLFG